MKLTGRAAVVTGANGFIGQHLVRALLGLGIEVTGIDIVAEAGGPALNLFDVRDTERMKAVVAQADPDYVFHLAALSQVTEVRKVPALAFATNAGGTVSILEAVRQVKPDAKVVVSTTDKVYGGMAADEPPATEGRCLRPIHPYDAAKAAADLLAQSYAEFYGLSVGVVRLCNVFGPGDRNYKRLVPGVMRDIIQGRAPTLRSDGTPVREYVYITDAVGGLLAAAAYGKAGVWNMGGSAVSVRLMVNFIFEALSRAGYAPDVLGTAHDESDNLVLNSAKALEQLGWRPKVVVEAGLTFTAKAMEEELAND